MGNKQSATQILRDPSRYAPTVPILASEEHPNQVRHRKKLIQRLAKAIRSPRVDESLLMYTKSTGLYTSCPWDERQVRKLIVRRELSPRYPGVEDREDSFPDQCPVCFLHYPMLNSTRCCSQEICTECFLQIRPQRHVSRSSCPFCKRTKLEVAFSGPKCAAERQREMEERETIRKAVEQAEARLQNELSDKPAIPELELDEGFPENGDDALEGLRNAEPHVAIVGPTTSDCESGSTSDGSEEVFQVLAPSETAEFLNGTTSSAILDEVMVLEAIWLSLRPESLLEPSCDTPCCSTCVPGSP